MINHTDIENVIGCKTLVTNQMQRAIEEWYDAAINGLPLDKNPETLTLDLPALICAELARLTTLELEAQVEGSPRADWVNSQLQRVLSPRRRRVFTVALALGSGIWKPYQSGSNLGISFCNASRYFPVSHDVEGNLTEGVFIDTIQDDNNCYHRMEWMHVLERKQDLRDAELDQLEDYDLAAPTQFPCIKVVNLAFRSSTQDSLGSPEDLSIRPEWDEIQPVAYLTGLEKLPVGYFVTPIINTVDPDSDLGAAMFEPARRQIIDADEQYTRLDWEYEGGELAVDTDEKFLKPTAAGQKLSKAEALKQYGVPPGSHRQHGTAPQRTAVPRHQRQHRYHRQHPVLSGVLPRPAGRQLPIRSEPVSAQCGKPRGPELRCAVSGSRRGKDRHRDRQQQAEAVQHRLRPASSAGGRPARSDRRAGLLGRPRPGRPPQRHVEHLVQVG